MFVRNCARWEYDKNRGKIILLKHHLNNTKRIIYDYQIKSTKYKSRNFRPVKKLFMTRTETLDSLLDAYF